MEHQACCRPTWGGRSHSSSTPIYIDEAEFARELNELSFTEREQAMDDLHGVSKVPEETPEYVDLCIRAMDDALDTIPAKKKADYTRALFLWPGLKSDTKFRLRFLRADFYDSTKAANRLVKYYAEKRKLFGEGKLVKTITLDDLNDTDLLEFSLGYTMQLPVTDQSGRPIVFYDDLPTDDWDIGLINTRRALWYNLMTAFEDETAQLKGVVGVNRFCIGPSEFLNPKWLRSWLEIQLTTGDDLQYTLPGRFSSFHLCIDSPSLGILVSSLRLAYGKMTRLRLRTHTGSDMENEYSLMTFGIPFDGILQTTRSRSCELHMEYIQRRREIERQKIEFEYQEYVRTGFVPFPIHSDVVFGRGRPYRDFPGTEAWNRVIADHYDRYRLGNNRFEKTCVAMEAAKKARNFSGIRFFLKSTDGGWEMIRDDTSLREKASLAFQNRAKSLSRMESRKGGDESVAKRRRYESSKELEGDELEDPFEPLPFS